MDMKGYFAAGAEAQSEFVEKKSRFITHTRPVETAAEAEQFVAEIKAKYPDAVLILLLPPSFNVQESRLRSRGTETEEKIRERLCRTREELKQADAYDYVVYNHDGKAMDAAEDILSIIRAERRAMKRAGNVASDYFKN